MAQKILTDIVDGVRDSGFCEVLWQMSALIAQTYYQHTVA